MALPHRIISKNYIAFYLSIIFLFIKFPLLNVLIYQEYYWNITFIPIRAYRLLFEAPVLILLSLFFLMDIVNDIRNSNIRIYICLLSTIFIWIFITIIFNFSEKELATLNFKNLLILAYYLVYIIIGYYIFRYSNLLKKVRSIFVFGEILLTLQIILFFNIDSLSIDYSNNLNRGYLHLSLGDSYAIWSILTVSLFSGNTRYLIYLVSQVFTFALGSRAAFYGYMILIPVFLLSIDPKHKRIVILILGILVIGFGILFSYCIDHRMFALFSGLDTSLIHRIEILKAGIPDLISNWFWGDYAGYLNHEYPTNNFLHNILSFWRQFGIVPFSTICILILMLINNFRVMLKNFGDTISFLTISLSFFIFVMILFAKGYTYSFLFILFGFLLAIKNPQKSIIK